MKMKIFQTLDEAIHSPGVQHVVSSLKADGSGELTAYEKGDELPEICKNDAQRLLGKIVL